MSDQWTADPGAHPPAPSAAPSGWHTRPGQLAPDGPPPFGSGPAVPPPAPTPEHGPPRTTRNLVIALSVLVVLLLVLSASLVWVVRREDAPVASGPAPTTAPPTTTPTPGTSTAPSSTPPSTVDPTPPGPAPTPEELDAEIAEMSEFVEQERGLTFRTPVEAVLADEAQFQQRLTAKLDEDLEGIDEDERVLKALGLMDGDVSLDATLRQIYAARALGFYDTDTGELIIRGQAITPYTRQTIVHELTHALDDQHFELHRPEYDDLEDETGFGFGAVTEGDARRVEGEYVQSMSQADRARRDVEEQDFIAATEPMAADLPPILSDAVDAEYEDGLALVQILIETGGQDLLDASFDEPPTTSSQVLHPELYLSGIGATAVDPPVADGEVIDSGMFGELMTRLTLEASEDPAVATNAAAGWAGDSYVTWQESADSVCIRIAYEMDTDIDLDELEDVYTSWGEPRGATVERSGDQLEVTSCSAAAGGASPL